MNGFPHYADDPCILLWFLNVTHSQNSSEESSVFTSLRDQSCTHMVYDLVIFLCLPLIYSVVCVLIGDSNGLENYCI